MGGFHWAALNDFFCKELRALGSVGLRRWRAGQRLMVYAEQSWHDVVVVSPPAELGGSKHTLRVEPSGAQLAVALSPFTHAPSELSTASFHALWKRHCRSMRAQHATITDALSGRRLNTLEHCVPIELKTAASELGSRRDLVAAAAAPATATSAAAAPATSATATPDAAYDSQPVREVGALAEWVRAKHTRRLEPSSDVAHPVAVLVTAGPAAGKTCMVSQLVMKVVPAADEAMKDAEWVPGAADLLPIVIRVQDLQKRLLDTSDGQDRKFAAAWNWIDCYLLTVHGASSELYRFLRQVLMMRRALLLLDGIDEAGKARGRIERHITEVLMPQGHIMILTSRPSGVEDAFSRIDQRQRAGFHRMQLRPLSDEQQRAVVEKRLGAVQARATLDAASEAARPHAEALAAAAQEEVDELMEYIRDKVCPEGSPRRHLGLDGASALSDGCSSRC